MHEMSTCRSLIKQVENSLGDYSSIVVKSVDVSIGTLSNIDIAELVELFPLASKNTITENAKLNITTVVPRISCLNCGVDAQAADRKLICPACHSKNTIPLDGDKLFLTNIELESEN